MHADTVDVWLCELRTVSVEQAASDITRLFGIDAATANRLAAAVPCVVKRRLAPHDAQVMAAALASIGGRVELRASAPKPSVAPVTRSERPPSTVRLGSLETDDVGFVPTVPPPAATQAVFSMPPMAAAPLVVPVVPQFVAPAPAALPSEPPPVLRHEPVAFEPSAAVPAIELDDVRASAVPDAWRSGLMLPVSDPPPAPPAGLHTPAQRERPPRVRVAPPPTPRPRALGALAVTAGIVEQARVGSVRGALSGHPMAGFFLVLGGTTLGFLVLYGLARLV